LDDYSARRLRGAYFTFGQQGRSSQNQGGGYAWAAAERIGMVIGLEASVAASM
jgi:hypothetical protein